jgi:hypothetical protein
MLPTLCVPLQIAGLSIAAADGANSIRELAGDSGAPPAFEIVRNIRMIEKPIVRRVTP